jgi:hypothetical protein
MRRLAALALCAVLPLVGCASPERMTDVHRAVGPTAATRATASRPSEPTPSRTTAPSLTGDPYADLARQLHSRGVDVWFEADLVKRWLEGPTSFRQALDRLDRLASVPGLRGFKVADELGYQDGLDTPDRTRQFLEDVRAGLRRRAPHLQVLVDMVVPELGCLGWTGHGSRACTRRARTRYPAASVSAVTGYLRAGLVDRLDLSTGMLDEWTYRRWGLTLPLAQRQAWEHVDHLGWSRLTVLQSRKALADVGGYRGSPQDAQQDVHTFVQIPTNAGAAGVDIWTWRQQYDGATVSLLDDRLRDNPLWRDLRRVDLGGVHLFTHMTPSLMPHGRAACTREYDRVASVFDAVFVAAGTG